jgi:S1-C subfamily serine protease
LLVVLLNLCVGAFAADSGAAAARVKSGTGFFVSPEGYLVTSAHVVAGCPAISVWAADGAQRRGRIVVIEPKLDIAVIKVPGPAVAYVPVSVTEDSPIGEQVLALGYGIVVSDPKKAIQTTGVYIGQDVTEGGVRVRVIRARLLKGNSGGPVVGMDGTLLGMVLGRYTGQPGHAVILPTTQIEAFLADHGLNLLTREPTSLQSVPELLTAISTLVQCVPLGSK